MASPIRRVGLLAPGIANGTGASVRAGSAVGHVRPIVPDDVPEVARLYAKVFGQPKAAVDAGFRAALAALCFDHPWRDDRLASLVYETGDGRISGCLGIVPRPMSMEGRSVLAAISHTFMVDPDSRGTPAALELIRAFQSGPQDLSIAQGTSLSRRLFEGIGGGQTSLLHSMGWTRILRPSRYVLAVMASRGLPAGVAAALSPAGRAADALAQRIRPFRVSASGLSGGPLEPDALGACLPELLQERVLRPVYDAGSLKWLLEMLQSRTGDSALHGTIVRDARAEVVGGYLYYEGARRVGNVVQIVAHPRSVDAVLDHLFDDARRRGLAAVSGQLDPRLLPALGAKHCLFNRGDGSWLLAHARDPRILSAIHGGDAFLTRLEAEWWIGFVLTRSLDSPGASSLRD
jgi:Acetyltransferase (GNAT) domain